MVASSLSSPELRSALALTYLQIGDSSAASRHLHILEADSTVDGDLKTSNAILKLAFLGDWVSAAKLLQARRDADASRDKHIQRAMVNDIAPYDSCSELAFRMRIILPWYC